MEFQAAAEQQIINLNKKEVSSDKVIKSSEHHQVKERRSAR